MDNENTQLENYIIRTLPADWTQREQTAFARRVRPLLMQVLNSEIRIEAGRRAQAERSQRGGLNREHHASKPKDMTRY